MEATHGHSLNRASIDGLSHFVVSHSKRAADQPVKHQPERHKPSSCAVLSQAFCDSYRLFGASPVRSISNTRQSFEMEQSSPHKNYFLNQVAYFHETNIWHISNYAYPTSHFPTFKNSLARKWAEAMAQKPLRNGIEMPKTLQQRKATLRS